MCFHDRLREFTFTDKQVVKMCLDCLIFESARRPVLCPPLPTKLFSNADISQRWDVILDDAGLNMEMGTPDWLMFDSDIVALQPHRQSTRKVYDMVDDHDWALRQKPFAHSLSMPRTMNNFCPKCTDAVVDDGKHEVRITRGVYRPINHDCPRVFVHDLQGKLIEVL